MFEIEVQDNHFGSRLYYVTANFSMASLDQEAVYSITHPGIHPHFKSETFNFRCKFRIDEGNLAHFNAGSLVGRALREKFLEAFSDNRSPDAIKRVMNYISGVMSDPGFTLGLCFDTVVSSAVTDDQIRLMMQPKVYGSGIKVAPLASSPLSSYYEPKDAEKFSNRAHKFSLNPLFVQNVTHPVSGRHHPLRKVIMDLNDNYGWRREQIADWLETLDIDINMKPKEKLDV